MKLFSSNRFWVGLIVCGVLSAQCLGCDFVYRLLQREGAEEKDLFGEVVPFEANAKVKEVQRLLKLYGYRVGNPDGKLGAKTREAIAAFQNDSGLKVSRFVDEATWKRLNMFTAGGLVVNGEIDPTAVQKALNSAGFDAGAPDGKMGKRTKQALTNFQRAQGLKPDGIIGYKTLNHLAEYLPVQEP